MFHLLFKFSVDSFAQVYICSSNMAILSGKLKQNENVWLFFKYKDVHFHMVKMVWSFCINACTLQSQNVDPLFVWT